MNWQARSHGASRAKQASQKDISLTETNREPEILAGLGLDRSRVLLAA